MGQFDARPPYSQRIGSRAVVAEAPSALGLRGYFFPGLLLAFCWVRRFLSSLPVLRMSSRNQ